MIRWFRNAAPGDKPKKQVAPVSVPSKPRKPKSLSPKIKEVYHGPKSPGAYKKRLYIPKKFITAADEAMSPEEMEALMAPIPGESPFGAEIEAPEEEEQEQPEAVAPTPATIQTSDPVTLAISSIPGATRITWVTPNPRACHHCLALNNHTWSSASAFAADKPLMVRKHESLDNLHLAHNGCSCYLKVDTATGERYKVDSMGNTDRL